MLHALFCCCAVESPWATVWLLLLVVTLVLAAAVGAALHGAAQLAVLGLAIRPLLQLLGRGALDRAVRHERRALGQPLEGLVHPRELADDLQPRVLGVVQGLDDAVRLVAGGEVPIVLEVHPLESVAEPQRLVHGRERAVDIGSELILGLDQGPSHGHEGAGGLEEQEGWHRREPLARGLEVIDPMAEHPRLGQPLTEGTTVEGRVRGVQELGQADPGLHRDLRQGLQTLGRVTEEHEDLAQGAGPLLERGLEQELVGRQLTELLLVALEAGQDLDAQEEEGLQEALRLLVHHDRHRHQGVLVGDLGRVGQVGRGLGLELGQGGPLLGLGRGLLLGQAPGLLLALLLGLGRGLGHLLRLVPLLFPIEPRLEGGPDVRVTEDVVDGQAVDPLLLQEALGQGPERIDGRGLDGRGGVDDGQALHVGELGRDGRLGLVRGVGAEVGVRALAHELELVQEQGHDDRNTFGVAHCATFCPFGAVCRFCRRFYLKELRLESDEKLYPKMHLLSRGLSPLCQLIFFQVHYLYLSFSYA